MVVEGSGKFIGLITANDVLQNFDSVEKVSEIIRTEVDYVTEDANVKSSAVNYGSKASWLCTGYR
jgi:predicted transcriptional regulator